MGGRAFGSGPHPLNVVRLPIEYLLLKFYTRAVVPLEAPEKADHGDIDFLADETLFNFTSHDLKQALGAAAHKEAGGTSSFAIRIPEGSNKVFQLDVHLCKKGCIEWEKFIYTYGDLWHIIGFMTMRSGLTINYSGLHIRIEKIETTNKKDWVSTIDELFEWAISTPLFRRKLFEKDIISKKQGRIREKRPMYAKFVTEWLLQAGNATSATARYLGNKPVEEGNVSISPLDERKEVLNKALLRFNKREKYQDMLEGHEKRALKDTMWKTIARLLPLQGKGLGQAMMALKASLWWDDGQPRLSIEADKSLERTPALDADTVDGVLLPWIKEHWREAVELNDGMRNSAHQYSG